jgi:MFS family permease
MLYSAIIFPALFSVAFLVLGGGLFMTFISLRMESMNIHSGLIGLAHSVFYFGMLLGSLKSKALIYRVGYIRANTLFNTAIMMSIIIHALSDNYLIWLICRLIFGYCLAAIYVIVESWILSDAHIKQRGKIMALYMLAIYVPHSASQFLLDFVNLKDDQVFLVASFLVSCAIIPYVVTRSSEPKADIKIHTPIAYSLFWQKALTGGIVCISSGMVLSPIYGFMPFTAQYQQLPVSYVMGILIAGGCVMQWSIGTISDNIGRVPTILMVASMNAIFALLISSHSIGSNITYIYYFCLGGGCFALFPLAASEIYDRFEGYDIVSVSAVLEVMYCLGCVIGSSIVSLLLPLFNANVIFYYILLLSAVVLVISISRAKAQ